MIELTDRQRDRHRYREGHGHASTAPTSRAPARFAPLIPASRPILTVNWPGLIDDIAYMLGDVENLATPFVRTPLSTVVMAKRLVVPRSTIIGWKDGSEPKHRDGEMLIGLWCGLSGKGREYLPMHRSSLSATKMSGG